MHDEDKGLDNLAQTHPVKTRRSDLEAFAYKHPTLDAKTVKSSIKVGPEQWIVETEIKQETFTHTSEEFGAISFNVRGIKDAIVAGRIEFVMHEAELTARWVKVIRELGGVEDEHVKRLMGRDLRRPGIGVIWPTGQLTVIDGNHRMVRRFELGLTTFRYAAITVYDCVKGRLACDAANARELLRP